MGDWQTRAHQFEGPDEHYAYEQQRIAEESDRLYDAMIDAYQMQEWERRQGMVPPPVTVEVEIAEPF